jgi:ribosomal protein L40E
MSENNNIEIVTKMCKICLEYNTLDRMRSNQCRKCISKRQNEALGKEYFKKKYEEQKEHRKEYSKKRYEYLSQCKKDIESQKNV